MLKPHLRRNAAIAVGLVLALVGTPALAAKPTPPPATATMTWSGKGTYVMDDKRRLSNEVCDAESSPYLDWVLSATKATSATLTLPDSATPHPMVKANRDKRGYSVFKLHWTQSEYISLDTDSGTPTINGDPVSVTFRNAKYRGNLSIEVGCVGLEPLLPLGDTGPGGGIIFYESRTPFTSAGSTCNTTCHYLEVAPAGWAPLSGRPNDVTYNGQTSPRTDGNIDPVLVWSDGAFIGSPPGSIAVGTDIGTGMPNTLQIQANTDMTGKAGWFAFDAALSYAGTDSSAGQWFIPSISELNELCKYARGQVADLGTATECDGAQGTLDTTLGFSPIAVYWSSTYALMQGMPPAPVVGQTPGYCFTAGCSNGPYRANSTYNGYYSSYGEQIRPVRAF